MSDERSAAEPSRMPNHIPAHILRDFEESARLQVSAERIYIETLRSGSRWRTILRRTKVRRWWPLLVWLIAVAAIATWLRMDAGSTVAFSIAAIATVLAVAASAYHVWAWRRSD